MDDHKKIRELELTTDNIAKAVYVVNRHAKTAPNPKFLYMLKKRALLKLLEEGKASKEGLHFSQNPKYSQQQSDVLVAAGDYYFHMPPTKDDFETLPHLGSLNNSYRNPKTALSLYKAKNLLQDYVGLKEESPAHKQRGKSQKQPVYAKPVFKKLGESYF
ncbi:hypothetical protein GJU40_16645 [Bacillus lacus]|uniref:YkyB-like protein n=1 Tax=Metabacillus lacus TaxID=1983721 RepID=A0A7X2J1I8_9BACI|nr:YkyB family protein [Metabacillus lacus]MRX73772.1 hypothetical protein [Metabacillus lacus]